MTNQKQQTMYDLLIEQNKRLHSAAVQFKQMQPKEGEQGFEAFQGRIDQCLESIEKRKPIIQLIGEAETLLNFKIHEIDEPSIREGWFHAKFFNVIENMDAVSYPDAGLDRIYSEIGENARLRDAIDNVFQLLLGDRRNEIELASNYLVGSPFWITHPREQLMQLRINAVEAQAPTGGINV